MQVTFFKRVAPLAGALLMAGAISASAQETIRFGLVSAFSGPAAVWGAMEETAVQFAIEDINAAGGVNVDGKSYQMELLKYDHAYDPTKAVTVVRQAIQQDGLKYLEVLGGGVIPAIQPITEPEKVLIFGIAGGEHWIGTKTPYTFKPYFRGSEASVAMILAAKQKNPAIKSVLAMYPDDDLGHTYAKALGNNEEKLGVKVDAIFTARDVSDFYPIALRVMQSPPDIIDFGVTPGSQYTHMMLQLRENGYEGIFIYSDTADVDAIKNSGAGDAAVGSYSAPYWSSFESERGQNWVKRYTERYGSVQMWTAQAYDNLWLLKAAMEKAGTFTDTEKVAAALGEVEIEGLGGPIHYGGADIFGLPRAYVSDIPVAEISKDGDDLVLEQVFVYHP